MSELVNLAREALRQRKARDPGSPIQSGDLITWQRADGTLQGPAVVDSVHTADDGSQWAFVIYPDGNWAALNLRRITLLNVGDSNPGGTI